jgi:hypothetical protein
MPISKLAFLSISANVLMGFCHVLAISEPVNKLVLSVDRIYRTPVSQSCTCPPSWRVYAATYPSKTGEKKQEKC